MDFFIRYLPARRRLAELIEQVRPDVLHVHWIGVFAYMVASLGTHPLVATAWGSDILVYPKESLLLRHFAKVVVRKADIITCDAEHMKAAIMRMGGAERNVRLVYFGTDLTRFHPGRKDRGAWRRLGFADEAKVVISLRALKPIYDVETFVRASRLVADRVPEARFVVVGDGSERQRLEAIARDMGVSGKMRFVGRLSDEDLQTYTASADVYVSTSLSDAGLGGQSRCRRPQPAARPVPALGSDR